MAKPQVLIIGSGLSGLALAQALRKHDIPFSLFERDSSENARFQGWALSLHSWIISDLVESTSEDFPDLQKVGTTAHLGIPSEGVIFDGRDLKEVWRGRESPDFQFIRADRAKLRDCLMTEVEIKWDKKFTHFQQTERGVEAFFKDGSSAKGDILVGADGVGSRVQSQLLQGTNLGSKRLNLGVVVGELTATEEQYQRWIKIAASFYVGRMGDRRIFVGLKSIAKDGKSARYYWLFTWHDDDASQESYWTTNASKEQLYTFVMNNIDDFNPDLVEPVRETPVTGIVHPPLQMRDMVPPELPMGRITLLGDAVHPMIPFRGEGGNHAMKDGLSLGRLIGDSFSKGVKIEEILKEYENEMRIRATKSVLDSRAAT